MIEKKTGLNTGLEGGLREKLKFSNNFSLNTSTCTAGALQNDYKQIEAFGPFLSKLAYPKAVFTRPM